MYNDNDGALIKRDDHLIYPDFIDVFDNQQMQDFAEVIIQRIKDAHQAKRIQERALTVSECEKDSTDRRKKNEHTIGAIEARQRSRVKLELSAISCLKNFTLTSESNYNEFYTISLSIFRTHSPSFQHKFQDLQNEAISTKIYRLYRQFLHKYANTFRFAHISSSLDKENGQPSPVIYLGWIGEWSRGLLAENLKKWSSNYESLRLRSELNRLVRVDQQKTKESQTILVTLESFYGHILSQLEEYYKRFQCLGLDFGYLKSIKQVGKKEQILGKNARSTIKFLIAKNNSSTATLIAKYLGQYQSFQLRKLKKKNKLIIQDSLMKQRAVGSMFTKKEKKVHIEQDILLNRMKSPRKNKELFGQPHKKLEFPLIQSISNNSAKGISPRKPKKNTRALSKTQPQEQTSQKLSILSSGCYQRSISNKQSTTSQNVPRIGIGLNVFNEFNLLESQFQSRRKSIVRKIKDKSNNFAFKEEVNQLIQASYLDSHVFVSNRNVRNSMKLFN